MNDADRRAVAEALVLSRYVGHGFKASGGSLLPTGASEARRLDTLRLAKAVGVFPEYVRVLIDYPVLSITVREFD